jgi:hypothetical protein
MADAWSGGKNQKQRLTPTGPNRRDGGCLVGRKKPKTTFDPDRPLGRAEKTKNNV